MTNISSMWRDIAYLLSFILLVGLMFWIGGPLLAPPAPYTGPYLPFKSGVVAVVSGALPGIDDVFLTIGSPQCLADILKTVYGTDSPTTSVVYVMVNDYMASAVIPYEVQKGVLDKIEQLSENGPIYFDVKNGVFDYMGMDKERKVTKVLYLCINKYTQQGSGDNTKDNHKNEINTKGK